MPATPLITLQSRLAEAEQAYHEFQMGRTPRVFVDQNGERIEYSATNIRSLAAYISALKFQISGASQSGPFGITVC